MANQIHRDRDREGDLSFDALAERVVAVLGFGNQGAAHALNLRDRGVRVVVGQRRESPGFARAEAAGFDPLPLPEAVETADLAVVALPDEAQPDVYRAEIRPFLRPGQVLGFLHGFNVRYELIRPEPDVGVVLVAPKGPGSLLRSLFVRGRGLPALFAVHQETPERHAREWGLAWASAIGCGRAGVIDATFEAETDTDLFGEQAVLCGGMTALILGAFETLVAAGYPPELAYLECCHEVKQIADLIYRKGIAGMFESVSNTAEFGAYLAAGEMLEGDCTDRFGAMLERIRSAEFSREMRADYERGFEWFLKQRAKVAEHPIEEAGRTVRALMPWLRAEDGEGNGDPKDYSAG